LTVVDKYVYDIYSNPINKMNQNQNKNFKYWCKEIKKDPRNEIIFHHWLTALIKETKKEA